MHKKTVVRFMGLSPVPSQCVNVSWIRRFPTSWHSRHPRTGNSSQAATVNFTPWGVTKWGNLNRRASWQAIGLWKPLAAARGPRPPAWWNKHSLSARGVRWPSCAFYVPASGTSNVEVRVLHRMMRYLELPVPRNQRMMLGCCSRCGCGIRV